MLWQKTLPDCILSREGNFQTVAGQVTMESPEEMVVTFAPYKCNSACQFNLRILQILLIIQLCEDW